MKVNGEAIYGTSAGPFKRGLPWGCATQKDNTIYLHVFDWPKDGRLLAPLANRPLKARLLATSQTLESVAGGNGVVITVPIEAPDKLASVIALEIDGPPQALANRVRPAADGTVLLKAADADIAGSAQLETYDGMQSIGYWTNAVTTVSWDVDLPAGEYNVELCYAGEPSTNGNEFRILAGERSVGGTIHSTGAWNKFATLTVGKITVPAGTKTITVKPTKVSGPVMNLRWIKLTKTR